MTSEEEPEIIDPFGLRWAWQYWKREAMQWQLNRWSLAAGLTNTAEALIAECQARLDESQAELDAYVASFPPPPAQSWEASEHADAVARCAANQHRLTPRGISSS